MNTSNMLQMRSTFPSACSVEALTLLPCSVEAWIFRNQKSINGTGEIIFPRSLQAATSPISFFLRQKKFRREKNGIRQRLENRRVQVGPVHQSGIFS
jgi:hypothetical protein